MNDDYIGRDRFYRIAFLLGVAALAMVFGSAAWILGRSMNMASASYAPAPLASLADDQPTRILSANKDDRRISAISQPAAASESPREEQDDGGTSLPIAGPLVEALPAVTDKVLGTPQRLAPWLEETTGRTTATVPRTVSTVTRTTSNLTNSAAIRDAGAGLAQTTSNVSGGVAKTAGGLAKTTGNIATGAAGAVRGLGSRLGL